MSSRAADAAKARPGGVRNAGRTRGVAQLDWHSALVPFAVLLAGLLLFGPTLAGRAPAELPYADFAARADAGSVRAVAVGGAGLLTGETTQGTRFRTRVPAGLDAAVVADGLRRKGIEASAGAPEGSPGAAARFLPFLLLLGIVVWSGHRATGATTAPRRELAVPDPAPPDDDEDTPGPRWPQAGPGHGRTGG